MLSLVVNPGLPEEQQFAIGQGTTTIGRTRDNAVFCLHKSLSRKHAQLEYDGTKLKITDLQSKNGIYVKGKRVTQCELGEGDTFRCGDVNFAIEAGTMIKAARTPRVERAAQTLPSAFGGQLAPPPPTSSKLVAAVPEEQRLRDKLYLLIRASELCVSELPLEKVLEALVALCGQALEADRFVLLSLDDATLKMKPRVIRTVSTPGPKPYSQRVVDAILDQGSPASFVDVSTDRTLPGDPTPDRNVRGAMGVPLNPGNGTIGVMYVDSLTRPDCFRPDDLALLRAVANLAALAIDRPLRVSP